MRRANCSLWAALTALLVTGLIGLAPLAVFAQQPPLPGEVLPPLPPPRAPELERLPIARVYVREIRVLGSTVLSPEQIARVTSQYENRQLTSEDLETLRRELTLLYVERGFVNSGAIIPDQTVVEGMITFQIIEGELTAIEVEGTRWFRPGYLRRRLALSAGPPLNVNALQEQIQILLDDPRIRRLSAELKPGARAGEGVLSVQVEEERPYRLTFDFNNHQPPSVGAERGLLGFEHLNLLGFGDILTLRGGKSEGVDALLDFRYAVPVTAYDTNVSFQYRRNAATVVDEQFRELDIESNSEIFTLQLRQPLYRTLNTEFAMALIGERLRHETFLLGERFSLVPGARNGEAVVTAVRATQEWVHRTQDYVLAARSRLSRGIDALGATIHSDEPDGEFFSWLGQFQWAQRLPRLNSSLIFRTDLQIAEDPLLTLEQVAVGGRFTVRGYRENTLVRDNAFLTSLEARVGLVRNRRWAEYLELAPFVDYGRAWNTGARTPDPQDIASVGIGLRWGLTIPALVSLRPQLEFYWGHPLRDIETTGGDLQDSGIHFQFVLTAF